MMKNLNKNYSAQDAIAPVIGNSDLGNDIELARAVQKALVTNKFPVVDGIDIGALYRVGSNAGGCVFEVVSIREDILCFYMLYNLERGIRSVLFAGFLKNYVSSLIRSVSSPQQVMKRLNAEIICHFSSACQVSAWIGFLNLHDNGLLFSNGGHLPPFIINKDKKKSECLFFQAPMLGASSSSYYDERHLYLEPGDWMFLYNPGFIEAIGSGDASVAKSEIEKLLWQAQEPIFAEVLIRNIENRFGIPSALSNDVALVVMAVLNESRSIQIKEKLGFSKDEPVYIQYISYYEEMEKASCVILRNMDILGYRDEDIRKMKVVLIELLANAIGHGNKMDHSKKVCIGHTADENKVVVAIEDEGDGFDPAKIPDPTLSENLIKDRGRGLYIVKQYVDAIEFNRKGNMVRITKKHHLYR